MVAAVAMVMVLVVVERRVEMVAQWLGLRAGLPGLTWMAARTHFATRGASRHPRNGVQAYLGI